MPKIVPNFWFDTQAEDAATFYCGIFPNSRITQISRYTEAATEHSPLPVGAVLTVDFELDGQRVTALNGGPLFTPNEAVSLMILCEDQAEIDHYWDKLTAGGGEESACGWLKDKYGFSWQVVPKRMDEMMADGDEARLNAVTAEVMKMRKLDLATLEKAYASHS